MCLIPVLLTPSHFLEDIGSLLSAGNLAQLQETAAALEAAGSPSELALPGRLMPLHPDDVEELRIEDIALTCSRCRRAWLIACACTRTQHAIRPGFAGRERGTCKQLH